MTKAMQETLEISRKINEISDGSILSIKKYETNKKLESAEERLKTVKTMNEYEEVSREVETLQNELQKLNTEIRIRPQMEKIVLQRETPKIVDTYNKEFGPYREKYKKLDKELKEKLSEFEKSTRPLVEEMMQIEKLESEFHLLTLKPYIENRNKLLKLPIDSGDLKPVYNFKNPMRYTLAGNVYDVINAIERNRK